jgi:predicted dehydrogenase
MPQGQTAALLGLRHPHSLAHLRTLQELPEVARIVLWDADGGAIEAARLAHPHKLAGTYTDLDTLLKEHNPLFAIICVPTDQSPEVCERALAAGLHLLAEKPIGRDAAEVARVVNAAARASRKLGVCYQNRYHPISRQARAIVGEGLLGPLISIEMRMLTTQARFRDPSGWLFQREISGGGVLSWLGGHDIDLMRYVARDEIVSVVAEVATRGEDPIDVEDVAVLALRFASGAVGTLHVAYALALSGGGYHNLAGYDTYIGFVGRHGRMRWSNAEQRLRAESVHPSWATAPFREFDYQLPESPAYGGAHGLAFVRDFMLACEHGGEVPASGEDALQVARVVEGAYESSASGRRISVARPGDSKFG